MSDWYEVMVSTNNGGLESQLVVRPDNRILCCWGDHTLEKLAWNILRDIRNDPGSRWFTSIKLCRAFMDDFWPQGACNVERAAVEAWLTVLHPEELA